MQQLLASPPLAAAAETRRFLDTEARGDAALELEEQLLPAALLHLVQAGLQRRVPPRARFELDRRAARAADDGVSLLVQRHGGGLLLLACAADPDPWLSEMRELVDETREAHFPELRLEVSRVADEATLAPWSPDHAEAVC